MEKDNSIQPNDDVDDDESLMSVDVDSSDDEEDIVEEGVSNTTNTANVSSPVENKVIDPTKGRGIVYLSTIQQGMNPGIIKGMLNNYGKVIRMYFVPGNRKNTFKEAWIEFENDKSARLSAVILNGKPIGGKRHSIYADKLWNIRYIKGLEWNQIFEEKEMKEMTREQKIEIALRNVKKQSEGYLKNAEKAKVSKFIKKRLEKKAKKV
ncbi:RRM domain-containing protein [Entamoeba marina]